MKKFTILLTAAMMAVGCWAQQEKTVLCGNIVGSDGTIPVGIYAFDLSEDDLEMTRVVANAEINAANGGTIIGNELHFVNRNADRQYVYHRFSTDTWQRIGTPETLNDDFKIGDFAYDETTNRLWAYFDEEWPNGIHTYSRFGYADKETKNVTILHEGDQLKREMMAVCMGPDNDVYAMDPLARLWKIDKETGEATQVSKLGMSYWIGESYYTDFNYSMVYDPDNNLFYITLIPFDNPRSLLVSLDINTGEVKEIAELGHEIEFGCLWLTDEMPDGIREISSDKTASDKAYTIDGRQIANPDNVKGLYIKNGKKHIK